MLPVFFRNLFAIRVRMTALRVSFIEMGMIPNKSSPALEVAARKCEPTRCTTKLRYSHEMKPLDPSPAKMLVEVNPTGGDCPKAGTAYGG